MTKDSPSPVAPVNLVAQYQRLKPEIDRNIAAVLEHGRFILGPEVSAFEQAIAEFAGARHAISVSSGTDALVIALWARGVGPGDAVFVPSFTFSATAGAVLMAGASPVFVDVDPETFLMDPAALEQAIMRTKASAMLRPRAVMPVDLFGLPADYRRLEALSTAEGLALIADAAQSFGAAREERKVGTLAPLTATSFFPTKPLGAFGDGGCLFTEDNDTAELCRSIRMHGQQNDDQQHRKGMTGRLDTLQAAILMAKLAIFPEELDARERIARAYDEGLADLDPLLRCPVRPGQCRSAWAQYTIRATRRDHLEAMLNAEGVMARVYYRKAVHLQDAFLAHGEGPGSLPVTESLSNEVLSLPLHPYLSDQEIDRVIDTTRRAARS